MNKKCVVSFADGAGDYQNKMFRLEQSLKQVKFDGDFLGFTSHEEIGCEPHSVIPYQFKPYAIQKAIDLGYDQVLWCDSPIYAKKPLDALFEHIENEGYAFFDNIGFSLGDYTNDKTLEYFDITREESWNIKMIMACVMGFNFKKNENGVFKPYNIFSHYYSTSPRLFPGEWNNGMLTESDDRRVRGHRHDQSVMSAILYKQQVNILKGQSTFFAYESHRQVMPIAESVCLFSY